MDSDKARPLKRRKVAGADTRCPFDSPCNLEEYSTVESDHIAHVGHKRWTEHLALRNRQESTTPSTADTAVASTSDTTPKSTSDTAVKSTSDLTVTSTATEAVHTTATATATVTGGALPILQSAVSEIEGNVTSVVDVAVSAVGSVVASATLSIDISLGNGTASTVASSIAPTITSSVTSINNTSTLATTSFNLATIPSSTLNTTASSASRSRTSLVPQTTSRPNATTTAPILFYITLPNGEVRTFTESRSSYTTLIDGRIYTIPGLSDSTASPTSASSDDAFSVASAPASETDIATAEETSGLFVPASTGAIGGHGNGSPAPTAATTTSVSPVPTDSPAPAPIAPPGTIAGGVVGGAAGLAVIVFIAMLFFRWYRRRDQLSGHHHLPSSGGGGSTMSRGFLDDAPEDNSTPGQRSQMSERGGMLPLVGALPALFRHPHGSLASTASSVGSPANSERGFTRVSGRKLPSQFSPGMSSSEPFPPPQAPPLFLDTSFTAAPVNGASATAPNSALRKSPPARPSVPARNPFASSRDSTGLLSADGDYEDEPSDAEDPARRRSSLPRDPAILPGPRRQPTLHEGSPYILTTPHGSEIAFTNDDDDRLPAMSPRHHQSFHTQSPAAAGPASSSSPSHPNQLASKASDSSFYRTSTTPTLMSSTSSYYDSSASIMTVTAGSLSRAGSNRTSRFTEEM